MTTDSSINDPKSKYSEQALDFIQKHPPLYGHMLDSVHYSEGGDVNIAQWDDAFTKNPDTTLTVTDNNLTTEKYIEILDDNLELYTKLKGQCNDYFTAITHQIFEYNTKINTAKTQEKKHYYTKKRTKSHKIFHELLERMTSLDSAINRVKEKKSELLEK